MNIKNRPRSMTTQSIGLSLALIPCSFRVHTVNDFCPNRSHPLLPKGSVILDINARYRHHGTLSHSSRSLASSFQMESPFGRALIVKPLLPPSIPTKLTTPIGRRYRRYNRRSIPLPHRHAQNPPPIVYRLLPFRRLPRHLRWCWLRVDWIRPRCRPLLR